MAKTSSIPTVTTVDQNGNIIYQTATSVASISNVILNPGFNQSTTGWTTTTGGTNGVIMGSVSTPYVTSIPYNSGVIAYGNSTSPYMFSSERLLKMGSFEFDKSSYTNTIMIDKNLITVMTMENLTNPEEIDKIKTDKSIYKKLYFIDESQAGYGKIYRFAFKEQIENKTFKEKLDVLIEDDVVPVEDDKMFLANDNVVYLVQKN